MLGTIVSDQEVRIHVSISGMTTGFRIPFLDIEYPATSILQLDVDELPIGKRTPIFCFIAGEMGTSINTLNWQEMIEGNPLAVVAYAQIIPHE